jgi:hypothetical protein
VEGGDKVFGTLAFVIEANGVPLKEGFETDSKCAEFERSASTNFTVVTGSLLFLLSSFSANGIAVS